MWNREENQSNLLDKSYLTMFGYLVSSCIILPNGKPIFFLIGFTFLVICYLFSTISIRLSRNYAYKEAVNEENFDNEYKTNLLSWRLIRKYFKIHERKKYNKEANKRTEKNRKWIEFFNTIAFYSHLISVIFMSLFINSYVYSLLK